MEEAYTQLYQEFLRLRSLCLKQAALLHQLTTALQKQQGASVPNGELSDTMSIPVQCTPEIPTCLLEKPLPLAAAAHNPAAQCGVQCPSKNVGTFSDLLAQDMFKLCVDVHGKDDRKPDPNPSSLLFQDAAKIQGASQNVSKHPKPRDHRAGDRRLHTVQTPLAGCLSPHGDFLGQSDALLMSDIALQSHVCEFCQAVFPGDTTTRGEFLRHLYTHIT
ncbi:uncharacterized protein LOC115418925 [Sphaeramia orbicularis]|uniref:uncharacterized protein LOC115418925 n=1 Tax=Sphaeramia orbicularis TaxID=375764 RepID=UPI00117C708C|nr:uncharacterized protein LOC115418925 [Sphaeramia orbicularis]XP_029989339.1 uncharacterized protein LOC115418925 [Sphaeramia orbicularis]